MKKHCNLKKRKIQNDMLIFTVSIYLVLLTTIIISIQFVLSKEYDKEIQNKNMLISNLIGKSIHSLMNTMYKVTEDISVNPDIINMDIETQKKVIEETKGRNNDLLNIYIQNSLGMQTANTSGVYTDTSSLSWFRETLTTKNALISQAYRSRNSSNLVTSIYMPIYSEDKVIGVVGSDVSLEYLQKLIAEYSNQSDGRVSFILDGSGGVVAHPDEEITRELYNYKTLVKEVPEMNENGEIILDEQGNICTEIKPIEISEGYSEMINRVMCGESGNLEFYDNGTKFYGSYTSINLGVDSDNWSVVTIQKEVNAKAIIERITTIMIIISIVALILFTIIIQKLAKKISLPIVSITNLLKISSTGDFTHRAEIISNNELGDLSKSYNEMAEKISLLIKKSKNLTKDIDNSMQILNNKSIESVNVSQEMEVMVKEISEGVVKQVNEVSASNKLSSNMNQKFQILINKSFSMNEEANMSMNNTKEGIEKVNELRKKTETTLNIIDQTEASMNELAEKSKSIEVILETLKEIADKTKLLSINASIESARVGEAGKSFGVVANEIEQLSELSNLSTKNIGQIINSIKNDIEKNVKEMKNVRIVSEEQSISVTNVNESFSSISKSVFNIIKMINDISWFVEEMNIYNIDIVKSIDGIANISQESAASSEITSNSIQFQIEIIKQVSKQTEEMQKKAIMLENEISKFNIKY